MFVSEGGEQSGRIASVRQFTRPKEQWRKEVLGENAERMASTEEERAQVGSYELLETLGKGAFATVHLARHLITEEKVRTMG